jgi:hypothetical protein
LNKVFLRESGKIVDVSQYDLLSVLNADIGENKCGTVMVKLVFLITIYSCIINMWVIASFAKRYCLQNYTLIFVEVNGIVKILLGKMRGYDTSA